jgi:hypothetical protein
MTVEAQEAWRRVYPELSEGRPGLLGALCAPAEAQTIRLALLYALLDRRAEIGIEHIEAGLVVWEYADASARHIWGDALSDPIADEVIASCVALAPPARLARRSATDSADIAQLTKSAGLWRHSRRPARPGRLSAPIPAADRPKCGAPSYGADMGRYLDRVPDLATDVPAIDSSVRTDQTKSPSEVSSLLSRSENANGGPDFWRGLYEERTTIRQYDGGYRRDEAERLAWASCRIAGTWRALGLFCSR